jgi:glycine oxidase
VIGLACAWRLARAGARVTVYDDAPGSGPSRVAAGMLAPVTEAWFGEDELVALMRAGYDRWPGFAAELTAATGYDLGYRDEGTLLVGADADDLAAIERLGGFYTRCGLTVTRLSGRECREREPLLAPGVRGGLLAPDHQVDPRRVHAALLAALGVPIQPRRLGSPAELAALDADVVVLAAGCGSAGLAGLPVRPVKGELLRLRDPAGTAPGFDHVIRGLVAGREVYVVPRRDGEVVIGATSDERGDLVPTAGAAYRLLDSALRLLPHLSEYAVAEHGVGLRPTTPDNLPLLGRHRDVIVATGHYRHGVLLAPITADVVTALVAGTAPPVPIERLDPGRFAGAHLA